MKFEKKLFRDDDDDEEDESEPGKKRKRFPDHLGPPSYVESISLPSLTDGSMSDGEKKKWMIEKSKVLLNCIFNILFKVSLASDID